MLTEVFIIDIWNRNANIHIHVSLIQLIQTTSSLSSVISTTEQGVEGALVKCLGDIYFNMKDNEPFHFIGEFPLHKEDVHLLISGVHLTSMMHPRNSLEGTILSQEIRGFKEFTLI